jgi:hypothetical protein
MQEIKENYKTSEKNFRKHIKKLDNAWFEYYAELQEEKLEVQKVLKSFQKIYDVISLRK